MAQTLGLRVVAEGVETLEQLKVLRQNNCDRMQGYFFAPALSPEEAVHLLMSRRCDSTEGSHSLETVSLI
jgi:EAL domain-containing protein (putative c-di-GMP-specific phosphodiesterase class I)